MMSLEPAVLENSAHHPAVLGPPSTQLEHTVVDVVSAALVVAVGAKVLLGQPQNAQVSTGHLQRLLQTVARLRAHTCNQGGTKSLLNLF